MTKLARATPAKSTRAGTTITVHLYSTRSASSSQSYRPQTTQKLNQPHSTRLRNRHPQRTQKHPQHSFSSWRLHHQKQYLHHHRTLSLRPQPQSQKGNERSGSLQLHATDHQRISIVSEERYCSSRSQACQPADDWRRHDKDRWFWFWYSNWPVG